MEKSEQQKEKTNDINYSKAGLKAGLEIHQQLDTNKLFCDCPSILRSDEPQFKVMRKLHAVAGESGKVDEAAEYEASLDKEFTYYGYDSTCLIELDEEPPHLINQEALKIALQIALLLNCKVYQTAQIMRKTVIDGSNTSGFQRTVLIAHDGYVETISGKVGINSVMLEEDAARALSEKDDEEKENVKVYKLDRLGIPLVEIATEPDIKTSEQAKEVALHIGEILRACKVKRGIGTIRQDINISIPKHPRTEIKGFQDPKIFVATVEKEIKRQQENLKLKKELKSEVRNANLDGSSRFLRPMPGAARMYPETDLPLLKIPEKLLDKLRKNLPKLKSDIRKELRNEGLSEEMIKLLFSENAIDEYKELLQITNKPNLIVKILLLWPKEISSKEKVDLDRVKNKLTIDIMEELLQRMNKGKINENEIKDIMIDILKGKTLEEAIKKEKLEEDIEEEILKIIKEKSGLSENAYMGLAMQKFKGKVSGKEVMEMVKRLMKK